MLKIICFVFDILIKLQNYVVVFVTQQLYYLLFPLYVELKFLIFCMDIYHFQIVSLNVFY